jgi:hypothetical protein
LVHPTRPWNKHPETKKIRVYLRLSSSSAPKDQGRHSRHIPTNAELLTSRTPIGHREIIDRINAQKAAEAKTAGNSNHNRTPAAESPAQRCRINAFRDDTNGQFYAMSHEDRIEADAAICQARVWLADGKKLQMLALYEQRIRRSIEKNEKQLKELQTERKAAHDKALEEAILLAQLDISEGVTYIHEESECPTCPGGSTTGDTTAGQENGFGFSAPEIVRLAHRRLRLQRAIQNQKPSPKRATGTEGVPFRTPKAA